MPFALFIFLALATLLNAAQSGARLNVLWICGDDHAPYVMGAYGNRQVHTPNLDRLAAQGMRFDRAYCNSPVCTASRQSFITGRYPRTIGVTQLKTALPANETTLANLLGEAGYETEAIGKMHFNSSYKHGFERLIDLPQHREWLQVKGKLPLPEDIPVQPAWKPFRDPANIWLNSKCLPFGARDAEMAGTFFAQQAAAFLKTKREKPFFLMVSFYEPHSPFHFPIEYRGRHKGNQFNIAKVDPADQEQIPEVFRSLTEQEKQGITAAYYTSTEFLDKNTGLVLDALKESGQTDNTLVIYTGDHGYMLGQHGRFEKHCGYEPAVRSALLIRLPQRIQPKQSTKALVEFIDIVPTILNFAAVPVPPTVQGKSLAPLLTGKTSQHRQEVFIEYSENEEAYICTGRWKFIYGTGKRRRQDGYDTGRPCPQPTIHLFDLSRDPEERIDLAHNPEHAALVADFTRQLVEHVKSTARQPERLPQTDDPQTILDFCLQPADVGH